MKTQIHTVSTSIKYIKNQLKGFYDEKEIRSIQYIMLKEVLKKPQTHLMANPEIEITDEDFNVIKNYILRLQDAEPIQYILGHTEFYGEKFDVNSSVLIPRPETEELVQWIIKENQDFKGQILDIGTGSGCIICTLSKYLPKAACYGIDKFPEALKVGSKNAAYLNTKIDFCQYDILNWKNNRLDQKFDIIVSNPPYIRQAEKRIMKSNVVKYEPSTALFVDNDQPLIFYETILAFSHHHLNDGGKIYFEINEFYGNEMKALLEKNNFVEIEIHQDVNGKDRMIRGIKKI